ncbi:GAF and ANTAR domain-containing protein [Streptomyces sp. NBC_00078]|uniref:GAF and ANTAR domain-containing protein n=1 Tax=unclassified Streptomyces TaxID=2593676 RepID=UPI0022555C4F|nr:GAF and ANTAR domain-containing protein [Streptomyces sp. NBC_00078]MCX5420294.1 GAF and ANTAR domain-containing protein [Streptomyces sp. NBC_00078]
MSTMSHPPRRLAQAFVDLAASPVTEASDPTGLLAALAARGTELLGDCAAIVLYASDDSAHVEVAGAGDEPMRLACDAVGWGEGPGPEARRTGRPVPDTALDGDRARRDWPRYTGRALELGYGRAAALPLHVGQDTLGALVVLGSGGRPLASGLLALGQSLTDAAGWALERDRRLRETRALADQLGEALTSRIVIEQAKGTLAGRLSISVDEAFGVLRSHARSRRRRLTEVAREVVDRKLDLQAE